MKALRESFSHLYTDIGGAAQPRILLHALEQADIDLKPGTRAILRASEGLFTPDTHFPKQTSCHISGKTYSLEYQFQHATSAQKNLNYQALASLRLVDLQDTYPILSPLAIDFQLEEREIGSRSFSFSTVMDILRITSVTMTRGKGAGNRHDAEFQGQGIGTGLTLLSNILIRDVLHKYPEIHMDVHKIYAEITDQSSGIDGSGLDRKGWTSHLAALLGYTEIPKNTSLRKFRYIFA